MALSAKDSVLWSSFLGVTGGLVSAVTSHPLDTIKTRLMTGHTLMSAAKPRNLMRGLLSPVLAVPPAWVANFVAYSQALRLTGDETTLQHAAAGALSGVVWAVTVCPFELVKSIAQNEQRPATEIWHEWQKKRSFSLSRGMSITMLRDVVGVGVWFGVYHHLSVAGYSSFVSGGISGCVTWLTIFPVDLLKTRFQTERNSSYKQSWHSLLAEMRASGSYFWRPIPIILLRQFVAIGSSMTVLEALKTHIV